jgi:hypothetical protein
MNNALRDLIDQHWRELDTERTSGPHKLRVSELPVDTANGRIVAAVDHQGHRHVLVPISSHQIVRRGLDGPVLLLRKRPLADEHTYQSYADLSCLRADLNDLFTALCADVLKTTESVPDNPIKALYRVLDRWKALFQAKGAPLGPEQISGLFGELTVLVRLLEKDTSAHRLWKGPSGHRHDFATDTHAVEVKASTSVEGRRMRIHGIDQMEAPADGTLQLVWFRLQRASGKGEGLVELVDRAVQLCDDDSALLGLLAEAGYRSSDIDHYRDVRFGIEEERWYEVDATLPKLTSNDLIAAGIPLTVLDVDYTIDLSTEPPTPLDLDRVNEHLTTLIRDSS